MHPGHFWPEGVITTVVISTGVGDVKTVNAFIVMPSPNNTETKHSEKQTTQAFRSHHNPNKIFILNFNLVSNLTINCHRDVRCVVTIIIVKSGVRELPYVLTNIYYFNNCNFNLVSFGAFLPDLSCLCAKTPF